MITYDRMQRMATMLVMISATFLWTACSAGRTPPRSQQHADVSISDYSLDNGYTQVLQGAYHLHNGELVPALSLYEEAATKNPSPLLPLRLAVLHARNVQFDQALEAIEQVLAQDPTSFEAMQLKAKIFAAQGMYPQAVQAFLDILALPPESITFTQRQGIELSMVILFIETKNIQQANQLLEQMLKEDKQNPLLYYYLGRVYTEQEQLEKAKSVYEKTVELNPSFISAWKALILLNDYFENTDESFRALEMVVQLDPNDIQARSTLIQRYIEAKNFSQVKKHQAYFAQRYEGDLAFCQQLLAFYYEHRLFQDGLDIAQTCLAKNPGEDSLLFYQALLHFRLGDKTLAKEDFAKIVPASDFYEQAVFAQIVILEEEKNNQEAIDLFEKSIKRKSKSVLLRQGYANYLVRNDQEDQAEKILLKTIRQYPLDEGVKLSLAEIYQRQGRYDEMENLLRSILAADPYSSSALNFLGYSLAERGVRLDEAQKLIVQAMEIQPDDGFIQDSLAWVYYQKKEYQKAKTMIEVALEREPEEATLWLHYGDILVALGEKQQARQAYKKAIKYEKKKENIEQLQNKLDRLDL
jgi:tetratricopeptide (TPR) repeat protein